MPRLSLGSDDEFVVKVAWEGPEEAVSTWEPVSRYLIARRPCCEKS